MAERRYRVEGEVEVANSQELQERLLVFVNATNDDLVLDCAALQFIDSTGVAVFMHTHQLLKIQDRGLRVENPGGMPKRTFDLRGLTAHEACGS
jgi:anti-anti-sigma factor